MDDSANKIIQNKSLYLNINQLNEIVSTQIFDAVEKSIPKYINRGCNSLQTEIVELIKYIRETRKAMKKLKLSNLKTLYNKLKLAIQSYRERLNFLIKSDHTQCLVKHSGQKLIKIDFDLTNKIFNSYFN